MTPLDTTDIQGLVVRGYGNLPEARFLLLAIRDGDVERARIYLRGACGRVNTAKVSPVDWALQIAFTARGLIKLGVPPGVYTTFAREFLEGMDDPIRATSLGDRGCNDPAGWTWGRTSDDRVHVLVMIYAATDKILQRVVEDETREMGRAFSIVERQTTTRIDGKEHFGWHDGISQPNFEGVPDDRPRKKQQPSWTGPLKPGEFVLGYANEYGISSERPMARLADDPGNHLLATADGEHKDVGLNGTYLVYRELEQDVHAFWRYLATSREPGADAATRAVALGAKMVGRWPSGAPLAEPPGNDDPARTGANTFQYAHDPAGVLCPIGAHIRRANPRNALAADHTTDESRAMVRKHQMVRRGRPFGPAVCTSMDPKDLLALAPHPDGQRRGLHFICLVGNISRQFEFVQRNWIQSANFGGLFKDADPLIGRRLDAGDENANNEFTCPASPVRRKYKDLPQVTRLVGGAYFFLPSLRALRFIAG